MHASLSHALELASSRGEEVLFAFFVVR